MRRLVLVGLLAAGLLAPRVAAAAPEPAVGADRILGFEPASGPDERRRALVAFGLEVVRAVPHLDLVRVRPTRGRARRGDLLAHPAVATVHPLGRFELAEGPSGPAERETQDPSGPAKRETQGPSGPAKRETQGPSGPAERETQGPPTPVPPPNDPGFAFQWNLPMIQVPDAWAVSRGAGAVVAVLDTGVAFEDFGPYRQAPDLAGTAFVPGYDFVDGDEHPNDELDLADPGRPAHGTHVTGTIAQTTGNGLSEAGVAPGAAIMPVRAFDSDRTATDDQVAAGLVFAVDHGAQVVNMSFSSADDLPMTRAAVAYAARRGVTMVAAAGNRGGGRIGYPARHPEVIAVGAVRLDGTRTAYSSFGPAPGDLDLMAPGGDLGVDQDGNGFPDGILNQTMITTTNGFTDRYVQGTSAAAPHVSAVAALLVGSGLATTPAQVRAALETSALDLADPGPDLTTGAGLVQARAALDAAAAAAAAAAARPRGYRLAAADGGIFTFGDAPYLGSTATTRLRRPVTGVQATAGGGGYWLVAADGGVFGFGDAPFLGSAGGTALARPVVAMAR